MGGRAPSGGPPPAHGEPAAVPRSLRERFGALRNLPPFLKLVWRTSPRLAAATVVLPPGPRVPAGGDALRRQAHHRRGRPPGRRRPSAADARRLARERARRPPADAARARARARRAVGPDGPRGLADRRPAVRALLERDQHPPDGARGDARPRGLRGQRAAGPPRPRAPADDGPLGAHEPALRPGAGRGDDRELRGRPGRLRAVADRAARAGARARVPGRGPLQRAQLLAELRVDAGAPRARLRAPDGRERRDREGSEDLRAERVPDRALPHALAGVLRAPIGSWPRSARSGAACSPRSAPSATTSPTRSSPGGRSRGDFTIGDLTFLSGSFRRLRNLLEGLLIGFSQVAGQALYLDDLFSFFEIRPRSSRPRTRSPSPRRSARASPSRTWASAIPGAERWAVRHLSFTLRAGEVLALVGENGAGKTTLVKLLARLYDPDEGRILLDGHDLREYDLAALRVEHRRHLPGLRALPPDRGGEHRGRPHRGARRPRAHRGRRARAAWRTR